MTAAAPHPADLRADPFAGVMGPGRGVDRPFAVHDLDTDFQWLEALHELASRRPRMTDTAYIDAVGVFVAAAIKSYNTNRRRRLRINDLWSAAEPDQRPGQELAHAATCLTRHLTEDFGRVTTAVASEYDATMTNAIVDQLSGAFATADLPRILTNMHMEATLNALNQRALRPLHELLDRSQWRDILRRALAHGTRSPQDTIGGALSAAVTDREVQV